MKIELAYGKSGLQVELPDGSMAYTRDGSFTISDQGTLVTHGGYTVIPGVSVPADAVDLTVSRTGVVTVRTPGFEGQVEVGRIELARFTNAPGMRGATPDPWAAPDHSAAHAAHRTTPLRPE